jgi:hypothetical protein
MSLRLSVLDQSKGHPRTPGETRHIIFPTGQYLLLGLENSSNHDLPFVTLEPKRNPAPGRPYPR